jgi:non-ribosomal peptide synthetase component F
MEETTVERLLKGVRSQQVTVGALLQTAWSMVLSRLSNRQDVLFGAAFSGRPTDLVGAESMVGPFVNNVPVRVQAVDGESLGNRLIRAHQHLLSLHPFQFVSSSQIQSWSKIPWQHRLCESLVVVQNYVVDSAARMMGESVTIENLDFPIHTNFPLLVLAEPNDRWRISIIFDRRLLARNSVEHWSADLHRVLASFAEDLTIRVDQVMTGLSPPVTTAAPKRKLFVQSQNHVPPQTATQKGIAEVWREVIRLDRVSIEDNLFDLGVHSLLVVQLHLRLQEKLGKPIGLVDLFRFPTIYALGQHLDREGPTAGVRLEQTLDRGQRQRQSMASMKNFRAKVKP